MAKKNTRHLFKAGFNKDDVIILNDEQLKKVKETLLEILIDFKKAAEQNGLVYTLSGGSVLGAVRHKGFIPWDDDIDINIPRADYNRLLEIFDRELGDKYVLCSPEKTHNHGMLCAQMKKKGTIYRSFNELSKDDGHAGICIDIFIIENTFDNVVLRKLHGCFALALGYLSTCRKTYYDMPYLKKYLRIGTAAEKEFRKKAKIGALFCWLSLDAVTHLACRCYAWYRNNESKYVSIPGGRGHYFKEMQLRSDLCVPIDVQFEKITVKIPTGYDQYLKTLYGADYMELPPVEKRESHPLMDLDFGEKKND